MYVYEMAKWMSRANCVGNRILGPFDFMNTSAALFLVARTSSFDYARNREPVERRSRVHNERAGMTRIATWSLTVLHTISHIPHPTHTSAAKVSWSDATSIASAFVGHLDTHA